MTVKEIQSIARKLGIKVARQKKAELIKEIQIAEGNTDCFGKGFEIDCGEIDCLWRSDCMPAKK
jgi:hypothetical protein